MSDYFFYDINKKMADLADKQQLREDSVPATQPKRQLNERDMGKHNNATTGFAALAKKTGGGEKGARIAGAQLAKMRAKGQVEEGSPYTDYTPVDEPVAAPKSTASAPKPPAKPKPTKAVDDEMTNKEYTEESAFQAAIGKKKYGGPGMKALQDAGRKGASEKTKQNIRNRFDKYDESMDMADERSNPAVKIINDYDEVVMEFDHLPPRLKAALQGSDFGAVQWLADLSKKHDDIDMSTIEKMIFKNGHVIEVQQYIDDLEEGNAFSKAVVDAKRDGIQPGEKIRVGGKQYPVKEAAKWRDSKHKDKLYTQNPPEDDADTSLDTYYDRVKPAGYQGAKRLKGGDEYSRTDPLTRGFGRSGTGSPLEKGPRKGLPARDQIRSLKGSIKDAHGTHARPNLPEEEGGGIPQTPKQKAFAKLAPPVDKITFADRIVGAKKEVDEVLGDVAANAMKKAVGQIDWTNLDRGSNKSSTGGRIDTSKSGVTRHHAGKSYSGAGHDAGADDEPTGALGRRKVGAGQGKKIGAKINRGTSKLMTRENDMDPADQGEYDREGEMAKDDIKTVVRHAQALQKILGDNDNLPEWVQAKLAKIEGMMTAVDDYMQNQQGNDMGNDDMEMDEESTNKRDNRAEKAGKKVAKDIEYDEKKKDGIHGKNRGGEDDKAEKAGKKVTKDIEYDEKKDKKKKEVDETTTSGSVATGGAAPKSSGGHSYGKGIYDSLNRQLENMISESMSINMSMNNDSHGGPRNTLTVTATDEDATMLAGLLKMAGLGHGDDHIHGMTGDDSDMHAIHAMDQEESCPACGSTSCGCEQGMDESYGDTDATENEPDWPTDEEGTDDAMMYSGGLNGPKSTGQTTIPVIGGQDDRMGYEGDHELRRMMEIAGLR